MRKIFSLIIFCILNLCSASQEVNVTSIQHVVRWVSESNFPNYTWDLRVQEQMLNATAKALQKKYKTESVLLPERVEYKYISGFGKASLNKPANNSNGYNVSVLSWITRATAGYAVLWKMEVMVQQNGKTIFSKQTEHELEYYSMSGYMNSIAWMDVGTFGNHYKNLIEEAFDIGEPLPAKIIIGSFEEKENEAKRLLNQPAQHLLKTKGNFLAGGNFIMKFEKDDEIISLSYIDGAELSSTKDGMSELGAKLLSSLTKLNIGYNSRTKQKRFGKLEHDDGKKLKLRMEWVEMTTKYTDGSYEEGGAISPIVIDVYNKIDLIGYFTFYSELGSMTQEKTMGFTIEKPQPIFFLKGNMNGIDLEVEYEPINELVIVSENKDPKIVVVMNNKNLKSRSFSGTKLSKNKVTMSGSSQGIFSKKPKFENPEWYAAFTDASANNASLKSYAEAILLMFFAIGNQ